MPINLSEERREVLATLQAAQRQRRYNPSEPFKLVCRYAERGDSSSNQTVLASIIENAWWFVLQDHRILIAAQLAQQAHPADLNDQPGVCKAAGA